MRKFKLINAHGQEFDLMRLDAFFHQPAGFGFGSQAEVQRSGNTLLHIKSEEDRPEPSGTISFRGYRQYAEFQQFADAGGIVLCYMPLDTWRYLDVEMVMEKEEIDHKTGRLDCPVQFSGLSFWYEKITAYRSETQEDGGKIYSYTYPYTYLDNRPGIIDVANGSKPSYCRIHILGPCTNPVFTVSQGDKRIADGRVICEIPAGNKLVIDSDPQTMEIAEYTANGTFVADRYGDSDFTTDRLIQLPAGNCRFSFTNDTANSVTAFVEVEKRV